MTDPDPLGVLSDGRQEDLGRGRRGEGPEKVVLDLPDVIKPDPIGQLDLLETLPLDLRRLIEGRTWV